MIIFAKHFRDRVASFSLKRSIFLEERVGGTSPAERFLNREGESRRSLPHRRAPLTPRSGTTRRVATRWDSHGTARPAKTQPSGLKRDGRHATVMDPRRTVAPASPCCPGTPTLLIPTAGYRECERKRNAPLSLSCPPFRGSTAKIAVYAVILMKGVLFRALNFSRATYCSKTMIKKDILITFFFLIFPIVWTEL